MAAFKTSVQSHVFNGMDIDFAVQGKVWIDSKELEWSFLYDNLTVQQHASPERVGEGKSI